MFIFQKMLDVKQVSSCIERNRKVGLLRLPSSLWPTQNHISNVLLKRKKKYAY